MNVMNVTYLCQHYQSIKFTGDGEWGRGFRQTTSIDVAARKNSALILVITSTSEKTSLHCCSYSISVIHVYSLGKTVNRPPGTVDKTRLYFELIFSREFQHFSAGVMA